MMFILFILFFYFILISESFGLGRFGWRFLVVGRTVLVYMRK